MLVGRVVSQPFHEPQAFTVQALCNLSFSVKLLHLLSMAQIRHRYAVVFDLVPLWFLSVY